MNIDAPKYTSVPLLRKLWKQAFGDSDELLDAFFGTAFSCGRCRCVFEGDEPVSALYWFDCECRGERLAYIYAVATANSYRGKGLCTALMDDTHKLLWKQGYKGAVLVPGSAQLFAFYKKMGYEVCSRINEYELRASGQSAELCEIGIEEYAALRRALLPAGGVIQEKENLSFLKAQASLYKGEGFLLAARKEKQTLVVCEVLGDETRLADALTALECTDGCIRGAGGDKPFAMYISPYGDKSAPPEYFGLAFD